jgi:hypothetical protein
MCGRNEWKRQVVVFVVERVLEAVLFVFYV